MKINRIIKVSIFAILSLIIIAVLGLFIWSKTGTYPAGTVALSSLESTDRVTIKQDKFIVFTPSEQTDIGLIFYPGGLVDPAAYAPVLHQIAQQGVLVVITPMPFNLAIFNTGAADAVMQAYPYISDWILAGHSLGGASAAIYANQYPTRIDALAFWDSYPPNSADLSAADLPVMSIFGTIGNLPNTENFYDKTYLLPETTRYVSIEGASHAQFGDYGPQKGDVTASISLAEQHRQVAESMLDFIFQD